MYPYGAPQYQGYHPQQQQAQHQPSNSVAAHNFGIHPVAQSVPNDYYSHFSHHNQAMMFQNPQQHHLPAFQLPVRPEVQASYPSAEASLAHTVQQHHQAALSSAGLAVHNNHPQSYVQGGDSHALLRVIGVPVPAGGAGAAAALSGSGPAIPGSPGYRPQPLTYAKPDPAEWQLPMGASSTAPPLLRADAAQNMHYAGPVQARLQLTQPPCMSSHCCAYCSYGRPRNRPMVRCSGCGRLHHVGTYSVKNSCASFSNTAPLVSAECCLTVEHEPLWGDSYYEFICGYCGQGVESYARMHQPSWQEITQLALLQLITSFSLAHETRLLGELKRLGVLPSNALVGDIAAQSSLDSVLSSQDVPSRRNLSLAVFHPVDAIAEMVELIAPIVLFVEGGKAAIPETYRPCLEAMISNVPQMFASGHGRVFSHGGFWTLTAAGVLNGLDDFLPPAMGMIAVLQQVLLSDRFAYGGLVDARLPPAAFAAQRDSVQPSVDPLMHQALNPQLNQGFQHSRVEAGSATLPLNVISASAQGPSRPAPAQHVASGQEPSTLRLTFGGNRQEHLETLRALNGEEPQLTLQALLKAQSEAAYLHVTTASSSWKQAFAAAAKAGKLPPDTARLVSAGDKRSFIYVGATVWGRVPLSWIILRLHNSVAEDALASARCAPAADAQCSTEATSRDPSPQSHSEGVLSGTDAEDASEDSARKSNSGDSAARVELNKLLVSQRQHHVWWPMQVAMPPSSSGSLTSTIPFLCSEHLWLESHDLVPLSKTPLKGLRAQLAVVASERAAAEQQARPSTPSSPALPPTSTPERRLNPARDGRNSKRGNRSSQALGQLPLAMRSVFFDAVCTAFVTCLLHCVPGSLGSVLMSALQATERTSDGKSPGGGVDALAAVAAMVGASYSAQGSSDSSLLGSHSPLDAPAEALLLQLGVLKTAILHAVKTTSVTEEQTPVVRQALLQAAGMALRVSFAGAQHSGTQSLFSRADLAVGAVADESADSSSPLPSPPVEEPRRTIKVRCVYEAPDKTHGAFSAAFAPVRPGSLPPVRVRMPAAVATLPQQDALWSFDEQSVSTNKVSAAAVAAGESSADACGPTTVEFVPIAGKNATAAAQLLRASGVHSTGNHVGSIGLLASGDPPIDASSSQRERDFKRSLCGLFLGAKCAVDGEPLQLGGKKRTREGRSVDNDGIVCSRTNIHQTSSLQVSTLEDEAAAPGAIAPARVLGDLLPAARQEVLDGLELGANKQRRLQRMWRTPLVNFGCSHMVHDEWLGDTEVTGVLAPADVAGVSTAADSAEDSDCESISSETSRAWGLAALDSAVGFMHGMHRSDRLSQVVGHHKQMSAEQRQASSALLLASESTLPECNPLATADISNAEAAQLDSVQQAHLAGYFASALRFSAGANRSHNQGGARTPGSMDDDQASVLSTDSLAHAWQLQSTSHATGRRSRRYADGSADVTAATADASNSSGEGGMSSSSVSVTSSDLGGAGDVTLLVETGQQRDGPLSVPLDVAQADVLRRHILSSGDSSSTPQLRKLFLSGIVEAFRQPASAPAAAAASGGSRHLSTAAAVQSAESSPSTSPASQLQADAVISSAPGGSAGPSPPAAAATALAAAAAGADAGAPASVSLSSGSNGAANSLQSAGGSTSLKSTRSAASSVHSKPRTVSIDGGGAGSIMSGVTGDSDDDSDDEDEDDEDDEEDDEGGPSGPRSLRKLEERGIFVIERIIRHKTVKRKRRFYVKWRGYGAENNSWVWGEDILDKNAIQEYDVQRKQRKAARIQRMRRGSSSTNPSIVATKDGRRKEHKPV